jgi:peptidyl-prolyl cis-trans isomerase D
MVLDFLRKKTRSVFTYIVFGLIIIVFVLYFGYGRMGERKENWVATINDQPISYQNYQDAFTRLVNFYQQMNKTTLDRKMIEGLGLKKQAYELVIDNVLLHQSAERLGFVASKAELRETIVTTQAFQKNGVFDAEHYKKVLWQNKLTPEEYESKLAQDLVNSRMRAFVQDGRKCSERELREAYEWENEKMSLAYVKIDPSTFAFSQPIPEEEVKQYYADHKSEFREPEKIKVKYMQFKPDAYTGQVEVSAGETEAYYKDFSEEFWQPKQVHARHILIRTSPDGGQEAKDAARKKLEEVLGMVKGGKSFEELAKKYSEDPGSAKSGGDLGFFSRGQMVKPFEDAAFALKAGEVSGIVETQFGFHLIKAEEITEEGVKPFEAVRDAISQKIREEKTAALIKKEAFRAYRTMVKTKDLDGYAKGVGSALAETDYFSRTAGQDPFQELGEAGLDGLFAQTSGDIVYPFVAGGTYYVGQVVDKRPSETPELVGGVKSKIEAVLKQQKQKEAARKEAQDLLQEARTANSLEALGGKEKLEVKETSVFTRASGNIPNIGASAELMATTSQLSPLAPLAQEVFEVDNKLYLVKLKEKVKVADEEFEAKKKDFQKTYESQEMSRAYKGWIDYARSRAKVEQNPRVSL